MDALAAPTALISVSDKRGVIELATALHQHGFRLVSTGGSAQAIAGAGLPVTAVSDLTQFPEIMGGRVKTLHPAIHGGILGRLDDGRDDARDDDAAIMAELGIARIDWVVVNLYPFAETTAQADCSDAQAIEQIDIGGPAMVRAAAKNHARVTVVCDPDDYPDLIASLPDGCDAAQRRALAVKAFAHTAHYDGQVSQWLAGRGDEGTLPPLLNLQLQRVDALRYGENPHQAAALYRAVGQVGGLADCVLRQGKALSYNNLLDAEAAWRAVQALGQHACVVIKHCNPCGAAQGASAREALQRALASDPTSAFGGIVAFNTPLDDEAAAVLAERFLEVVVAPEVSAAALQRLASKPALRVMTPTSSRAHDYELRAISGGWLAQQPDDHSTAVDMWQCVTQRQPDAREMNDLQFAWAVVRSVRSNAIVYARDGATLGIGAGQMSRVDAARFGALKAEAAGHDLTAAVLASDAFFPFADGVEAAIAAGVRAVIQPGGSKRDDEVIAACDQHGIAMLMTGYRHFRH